MDSDHAFLALLTAEVPAVLKLGIAQGRHHEAFGEWVGVAEPWSRVQSENARLILDQDAEQTCRFGSKELLPRVCQLACDLVQNRSEIDSRMQPDMEIQCCTTK